MCLTKFLGLFLFIKLLAAAASSSSNDGFTFYGLVDISGISEVRPDGLLRIKNGDVSASQVVYYLPFTFKNSSSSGANSSSSFSTDFVFAIVPNGEFPRGYGMAFLITPSNNLTQDFSSRDFVALEIDTFRNVEFDDIDDNHVGIDTNNSLISLEAATASYVDSQTGKREPIDLASGKPIRVWIEYDGLQHQMNVTLSPLHMVRPKLPLLSFNVDISPLVSQQMYAGFTTSTGQFMSSQYILGWSFQMNGKAEELDVTKLPSLPVIKKSNKKQIILAIVLSLTGLILLVAILSAIVVFVRRKKATFSEIVEDWEIEFGPHRFAYKDLALATKDFNEKELLGEGGFGKVFKGELPVSKNQIAVKRILQKSDQGMKEFIAEISTLGRVRHPNLVRLLGYCRGKDELLLVYDYMPNGSLDKFLHNKAGILLSWDQRYGIIKDVASALAYLHEEWAEEVIIHRDIKASNVLLDGDFRGKLGDFGLARWSKHAQDPKTTHVAGTYGYMAPELGKTGKASTRTDVYAFGAFCLEVACGRRPIKLSASDDQEVHLVDWVLRCLKGGDILKAADSRLGIDFEVREIELVLKLGLLCSHNVPAIRPRMSQVVLYLRGQASLPENLDAILQQSEFVEEFSDYSVPCNSKVSDSFTNSFLTTGR